MVCLRLKWLAVSEEKWCMTMTNFGQVVGIGKWCDQVSKNDKSCITFFAESRIAGALATIFMSRAGFEPPGA